MLFIVISLFAATFSHADRFDGEPYLTRTNACNTTALNECRARAQIAIQECQNRANSYASQENIVLLDINSRRENLASATAAQAAVNSQMHSARAELQFLDDLEQKNSSVVAFFPGSPRLDQFFSMDRISMEWDEKYPLQYRLKLKDQESELAISSQKITLQQNEIENEISLILPNQAFLSTEKNRWLGDVKIHAHMFENGCWQQVCPNNF
jgi:hypothetical protein